MGVHSLISYLLTIHQVVECEVPSYHIHLELADDRQVSRQLHGEAFWSDSRYPSSTLFCPFYIGVSLFKLNSKKSAPLLLRCHWGTYDSSLVHVRGWKGAISISHQGFQFERITLKLEP